MNKNYFFLISLLTFSTFLQAAAPPRNLRQRQIVRDDLYEEAAKALRENGVSDEETERILSTRKGQWYVLRHYNKAKTDQAAHVLGYACFLGGLVSTAFNAPLLCAASAIACGAGTFVPFCSECFLHPGNRPQEYPTARNSAQVQPALDDGDTSSLAHSRVHSYVSEKDLPDLPRYVGPELSEHEARRTEAIARAQRIGRPVIEGTDDSIFPMPAPHTHQEYDPTNRAMPAPSHSQESSRSAHSDHKNPASCAASK